MKKIYQVIILLSFINILQANHSEKIFQGCIQFPYNEDKTLELSDEICLYYKGQKLTIEPSDHLMKFSFLESKKTQEIYIIITNNISCTSQQNNTIQHLKIKDSLYKCYKLQALRIQEDTAVNPSFSWSYKEEELDENIIPDNSVIFLFNPDLIAGISPKTWSKYQGLRLLPTIIIKQNTTGEQIARAIAIAKLASIDLDLFHSKNNFNTINSSPSLFKENLL